MVTLLAQATPTPATDRLIEYGVLGVLVSLLLAFARYAYSREAERADRLEAELRTVRDRVEERVLPALHRAIDAVERSTVDRAGDRWRDRHASDLEGER